MVIKMRCPIFWNRVRKTEGVLWSPGEGRGTTRGQECSPPFLGFCLSPVPPTPGSSHLEFLHAPPAALTRWDSEASEAPSPSSCPCPPHLPIALPQLASLLSQELSDHRNSCWDVELLSFPLLWCLHFIVYSLSC